MTDRDWGALLAGWLLIGLGVAFLLNYSVMPTESQESVHSFTTNVASLLGAQPGILLAGWAVHAYFQNLNGSPYDKNFRPSKVAAFAVVTAGLLLSGLGMWVGEDHWGPGVVRGLEIFTSIGAG